jgi:uncharacterized membrane protein
LARRFSIPQNKLLAARIRDKLGLDSGRGGCAAAFTRKNYWESTAMENWNGVRRLQVLGAMFAVAGLVDSIYLWSFKWGGKLICAVGGCEAVNTSSYSSLLGVPVAAIGAAGYAALLALAVWALLAGDRTPAWLNDVRLTFASIGLFFAAYLTIVELFILHDICMWCVLQAVAITAIFVGLLAERRREGQTA